jgi:hypothetical protein
MSYFPMTAMPPRKCQNYYAGAGSAPAGASVPLTYGVCSPLTQLILSLFEANNNVNLVFTSVPDAQMPGIGNASTSPISTYNPVTHTCDVTVRIRESYLETATDLSIARTAIHESLHAVLVYMLEEELLSLPDGTTDPTFADLVNAHIDFLSGSPEGLGQAHHELMASFVEDIATSLLAFGLQNGYNLPFSYYNDMAWGGLTVTKMRDAQGNVMLDGSGKPIYGEAPWFVLAVPNPADRDRITNRSIAEMNNQPSDTEIPSGNPCPN